MAKNIRLGIIGSAGRMGESLAAHVARTDGIETVAELDAGGSIGGFIIKDPEVVVDLSLGSAVAENGPAVVAAGIPYIVGATAIPHETISQLKQLAAEHTTPVLVVPNFSLGANLMIRFSAAAARLMEYPVVTERHHEKKQDAPSGTAVYTANRIAGATGDRSAQTAETAESLTGVMGADVDGVKVHSIRGTGYLAEQEVRFSLPGESLSIEHRSIDRSCFMPGIVYAIRNIHRVDGLAVGLDTILDS